MTPSPPSITLDEIDARERWWQAKLDTAKCPLAEELAFWRSEVALCVAARRGVEAIENERIADVAEAAISRLVKEMDVIVERAETAEAALAEAVRREREECAKICDAYNSPDWFRNSEGEMVSRLPKTYETVRKCADAIRARDQRGPAAQEASSSTSLECDKINHQGNKNEQR